MWHGKKQFAWKYWEQTSSLDLPPWILLSFKYGVTEPCAATWPVTSEGWTGQSISAALWWSRRASVSRDCLDILYCHSTSSRLQGGLREKQTCLSLKVSVVCLHTNVSFSLPPAKSSHFYILSMLFDLSCKQLEQPSILDTKQHSIQDAL